MVAIVVVSHSARLAGAVVELAREIAGPGPVLEAVGGADADGAFGSDAGRVRDVLERAAGAGRSVVVLADLGSAVIAARRACELLPPAVAARVEVSTGPLVEGAIAGAVAAAAGGTPAEVADEAGGALRAKAPGATEREPSPEAVPGPGDWLECHLVVTSPVGLHARPASRLVQTAAAWDAEVTVTNASTGAGPASARSLTAIQTLGAMQGHRLLVRARGPQGPGAIAALQALAARGFDEIAAQPPEVRFVPSGPAGGRGLIRGLIGHLRRRR